MTDRTRSAKTSAQDLAGIAFCLVGGLFVVSIAQFLLGKEPKPSVEFLMRPVLGLVAGLGSPAALLFAVGLATLGVALFLRTAPLAPLRPLGALALGTLGTALVCGAFAAGGTLGGWLPGLVGGFLGRAIGVTLGAALVWLGWSLSFLPRAPRESAAEAFQRIGLSSRQDAAGVSPAEAALLVPETRPAVKPAAPRAEPLRIETLRPRPVVPEPVREPEPRATPASLADPSTAPLTPPAPTWERAEDAPDEPAASLTPEAEVSERLRNAGLDVEVDDEADVETDEEAGEETGEDESLETLRASRAEVFPARAEADEGDDEFEDDELDEDEEEDEYAEPDEEELVSRAFEDEEELQDARESAPPEPALPAAPWEQVGLFDELDEAPQEAAELTPSFDFEAPAPKPAPASPSPQRAPVAAEPAAAVQVPEPADFTLTPAPPRPAPVVARDVVAHDEEREGWDKLVFESGCLILEQKRVAVSMLERRFGIDFDRACKVLDQLQQDGLIGPYIGGRSRDILLTREEWLPHAPHAS